MYIKLNKDDYVVKINIDNFSLGMGNLEVLLDEIISNKWNWFNFSITDKLWYNSLGKYQIQGRRKEQLYTKDKTALNLILSYCTRLR